MALFGEKDKKFIWFSMRYFVSVSVWPIKSCQMSIKLPKNDSTRKWNILLPLQKLPKMWAISAKYLLPHALKSCPKCNKASNLVTLVCFEEEENMWQRQASNFSSLLFTFCLKWVSLLLFFHFTFCYFWCDKLLLVFLLDQHLIALLR